MNTHVLYDTRDDAVKWLSGPYTVSGHERPLGPLEGEEDILHLEVQDDPRPDYDSRRQRAVRGDWYRDDDNYRRSWTLTDDTQAEILERLARQVDSTARELRDAATAGTSPAEMASWSLKRSEALVYSTEPADQTEANTLGVGLLYAEAQVRDATTQAIANRVIANATALTGLEAQIAGNAGKLRDALAEAGTIDEMLAIDLTAGWPDA